MDIKPRELDLLFLPYRVRTYDLAYSKDYSSILFVSVLWSVSRISDDVFWLFDFEFSFKSWS